MGPERVAAGLAGHRIIPGMDSFYACFLGCAFGRPGELMDFMDDPSAPAWPWDLTSHEFEEVWQTVDESHDAFWALANEWLENRPVSRKPELVGLPTRGQETE